MQGAIFGRLIGKPVVYYIYLEQVFGPVSCSVRFVKGPSSRRLISTDGSRRA